MTHSMHNSKVRWRLALLMGVLLALALTVVVYAQANGDFDLSWNTIDNGGGVSTGGDFGLSGSIGQADAGMLSGGDFALSGGFWIETSGGYRIMLPLVVK